MLFYNPKNGAEFDTESDDPLHNQVYVDMGLVPAPTPEPASVGRMPEPITYAPVTAKTSKKTASTAGEESTD